MSRYLMDKFTGKYRVKAELDMDTQDFVRDAEGNLDQDYDDYYIPCRGKMKIKHGCGSMLWLYCPSSGTFYNVIREYYKRIYGKELKDYNKCADKLLADGYATDIEFLDGEGCMEFNIKHMDIVAKVVKPSTYGASISPHSTRNLPKAPYDIPRKDMEKYRKAKEGLEPFVIGSVNIVFGKNTWGDDYNVLLRKAHLKAIQFFHKEGKWDEYCEYISEVKR